MPSPQKQEVQPLSLDKIKLERDIQPREELCPHTIEDYRQAYSDAKENGSGNPFPVLRVFVIGGEYVLTRGYHRYEAAVQAGWSSLEFEVIHKDDREAAFLDAIADNCRHGLRYTSGDKRRILRMLLRKDKYREMSARELAAVAHVSKTLANDVQIEVRRERSRRQDAPEKPKVGEAVVKTRDRIKKLNKAEANDPDPTPMPIDVPPESNESPPIRDPEEEFRLCKSKLTKYIEASMRANDELNRLRKRNVLHREVLKKLDGCIATIREWR